MNIAIIGTSRKAHERRLPLHPAHFEHIAPQVRQQLFFESGYGAPFGISDRAIANLFGGVASRAELLANSEMVLLSKPLDEDAAVLRSGATLWGWIHCVQNPNITQIAIDRQLTFLTWERMNVWD